MSLKRPDAKHPKMKISKIVLVLIILLKSSVGLAQWSADPTINNPITAFPGNQFPSGAISDGTGGMIVIWKDNQNEVSDFSLYAQRIDFNGVIQWQTQGILITATGTGLVNPKIMADGNGGAIIIWGDNRNNNFDDLYAQKIDASGTLLWGNGVAVCIAPNYGVFNSEMATDGHGGAIITWTDYRTPNNSADIYAQALNASGNTLWETGGIAICANLASNDYADIASDGNGGAVITWVDSRSGELDIYAQRVNASGIVQWNTNGNIVCAATNDQATPLIMPTTFNSTVIIWGDNRNAATNRYDIYAQNIRLDGTMEWPINGKPICTAAEDQTEIAAMPDGLGGAIITWTDYRTTGNSADIYVQRINSGGTLYWAINGIPVATGTQRQWFPAITQDGIGGAIISWADERVPSSSDIYAQHVSFNGFLQWTASGVPVCTADGIQRSHFIVSDEHTGAILAWGDGRSGTNADVYAQRLNPNGTLDIHTAPNTSVNIHPNPSKGLFTVASTQMISQIRIINQLGEIVFREDVANLTRDLDLTNLPNGIYICQIILDDKRIVNHKLLIAH